MSEKLWPSNNPLTAKKQLNDDGALVYSGPKALAIEPPPITYVAMQAKFGITADQVRYILRTLRITQEGRVRLGGKRVAFYHPDTMRRVGEHIKRHGKPTGDKTPHEIKELGAAGAREKHRKSEAAGLNAAYERREPSAVSQPPAGLCQYPGCEKPARIGRYCANANHYARRWVDSG